MAFLNYFGAFLTGLFGLLSTLRGLENILFSGVVRQGAVQAGIGVLLLVVAVKFVQSARAARQSKAVQGGSTTE